MILYEKMLSRHGGKNFILIFVERLTGFLQLMGMNAKKPRTIIKALERQWIGYFGISDNIRGDSMLEGREMIEWAKSLGIRVTLAAYRNHRSNGLVERINRCVNQQLKKATLARA